MRTQEFHPSRARRRDDGALSRLGPYELDRVVGRGGGGVVYHARGPEGPVAVKTLARSSVHGLASLRAEIHALRRVRHAGIVRVHDDGVEHGRPWFAMEWLEGDTLRARIEQRAALTPELLREQLLLCAAICEPLAALHESGIVHRDLKPDNVFLRHGHGPVLVDFGLATHRSVGDVRATFDLPALAGTAGYMAPEQRTGALVDARTDLYALGCILFELLVGVPYDAFPEGARPSQHVIGVPPEVDTLVASLLAPRARDRVGHADDVAATLAQLTDSAPKPRGAQQWLYRPFLSGRHEVVARLSGALETLHAGRGSFVALEGESGIGKTHVVAEIARRAAPSTTVISAACTRDDAAPLACFSALFELVVDRTLDRPESFVATAVARHLPLLVRLHSTFDRLGGAPASVSLPTPDEVFGAIRELVGALTDERPVLLLVDDLQWIDDLSRGVLQQLTHLRALLVLATFRDDERTGWPAGLEAERIALGPLPEPDVHELVADMLGTSEPPAHVSRWVARHAEGNPYLAAEYLRLVVSELPLVRVQPPPDTALERLPMPGSVRELVGRRLDGLPASALQVAELVAILGGTLDANALEALEQDEHARDALFELERRQLIEPTGEGGRKLLHDRLRSVLDDRLGPAARVDLHRRAAALLESTETVPHAAIARHLVRAGEAEAALPHLERAAELALSRAAHEAAVRLYDELRAVATQLPVAADRRTRWEIGSAHAHYGRGDMVATERHVREALHRVGRPLPTGRGGWTLLAAREAAVKGLASLGRRGPQSSALYSDLAQAASLLPYRYFYAEDLLPVIGTALLSANLARNANDSVAAGPISLLAMLAGLCRLPRLSQRYFETAARGAWEQKDYREAAQVLSLECMHHGNFASWADAERAALGAADACARTSDPWLHETVETSRAHVEYFTGRFESARRRALEITRVAEERQHEQHAVWGLYLQARSDLPFRRWQDAEALLEEALRRLAGRHELISEVACRGMLAHAAFELGDHARAESHALWVADSVSRRAPPAYPSLVGYAGAATVLRALAERAPSAARGRAVRSIGAALWRFASMFPVALPAACLHTASTLRSAGAHELAHTLFVRGARWAEAHTMPWDRALLLQGAGDTARAQIILEELGVN